MEKNTGAIMGIWVPCEVAGPIFGPYLTCKALEEFFQCMGRVPYKRRPCLLGVGKNEAQRVQGASGAGRRRLI